jgi:hypothetical protein
MVAPSHLIVSIGMPRAGSGWHFNLVHDLVVAAGGKDARLIRRRFYLQAILTEVNCNIGTFNPMRLLPVMIPVLLGNQYVIKAHAGVSPLAMRLIRSKKIYPTYIYRDPRDALLSAYEYGLRKREVSRSGAFAKLHTIEQAITFMKEYVQISESWLACEQALHTRYEDLLLNFPREAARLVDFLGLDPNNEGVKSVIGKYRPAKGRESQTGTHFVKGKIGRFRDYLTEGQQRLCIEAFGQYLEKMRYPVP